MRKLHTYALEMRQPNLDAQHVVVTRRALVAQRGLNNGKHRAAVVPLLERGAEWMKTSTLIPSWGTPGHRYLYVAYTFDQEKDPLVFTVDLNEERVVEGR